MHLFRIGSSKVPKVEVIKPIIFEDNAEKLLQLWRMINFLILSRNIFKKPRNRCFKLNFQNFYIKLCDSLAQFTIKTPPKTEGRVMSLQK